MLLNEAWRLLPETFALKVGRYLDNSSRLVGGLPFTSKENILAA
jgi:hypothetical protein